MTTIEAALVTVEGQTSVLRDILQDVTGERESVRELSDREKSMVRQSVGIIRMAVKKLEEEL